MAGARIEIDFDDAAVMGVLARARARLEPDGMQTMLADIGEYMVRSTRERAELEVSPSGARWDPLSPAYAKRKQKKRPGAKILHFDFHMLGDQFSSQVDGDTLLVGTNALYGATHQFGRAGVPPREWLGVSDADAEEIKQITLHYLQASVDGSE